MGSRIKENPQKIFDLFFEAACSTTEDDDPRVLRQFPREFDDQESIQMLPRFCFPFDIERMKESPTVQHFTFALTDMEGKQRFGFCRLAVGLHSCLCILSYLPWFEVFYKILNYIADNLVKGQFTQLDEFLSALHAHPVPNLGSPISLEFDPKVTRLTISTEQHMNRQDGSQHLKPGTASAYFIAPDQGKLPTIPENRNLTEFVVAVDVNNMLQLYASLLHERRIMLTTSKLSTLTACVQASSSMLYPMHWQHIYIPALPSHLLDYCCAPMPYLIGVHTSLMERVRSKSLEDVVILNIDSNTMESPFQDLENLPSDVVSLLKFQLKKQSATTGDGVARAFLRAQALLFGGYREALMFSPGKPIFFSQENFLHQGSSAMQAFLQRAVHLQLFKEFIEDRLERLNAGEDVSDLFEQEINRSLSPGSLHAYQLWVENLKKGGGALLTSVKNKANPAVRSVYQYAKGHAKMGLKHMRSHLMEKESSVDQHRNRVYSMNCDHISSPIMPNRSKQSETLQNRLPITQHFGKSRPRRPQRENSRTELEAERDDSTSSSMASLDCCSEPEGGENLHASFLDPGGLDLLGEIFETLNFLEPSQTGQPLYSTRSLDFCNLEERNFYTKLRTSRDTLYEPLSEEQDAGDPFPEDKMSLGSLDQEYRPRALPLAATTGVDQDNEMHDCDIMEPKEIGCPKKATVPLLQQEEEEEEEEDEEVATPASCEQSQVSWTLQVDPETSVLAATSTRVASGEETGIVHVDGFPTATQAEPPATGCSSTPSPVPPSFQLKVNGNPTAMPKKSVPVLGQASTSQSRAMSLSRVSELKKRFEA